MEKLNERRSVLQKLQQENRTFEPFSVISGQSQSHTMLHQEQNQKQCSSSVEYNGAKLLRPQTNSNSCGDQTVVNEETDKFVQIKASSNEMSLPKTPVFSSRR